MEPIARNDALKYVKFGTTDMMVSEVCGGTMTWGSFNAEEKSAHDQLDAMVRLGVNFIDTAELYPVAFNYGETTEKWIGNWLEKSVAEGKVDRSKLYLATKANPSNVGAPEGREKPYGFDAAGLKASCKASLERLKCQYIDLFYLHWPTRDVPVFGCASYFPDGTQRPPKYFDNGGPEVFEAQALAIKALFDEGLIKHWALSNENSYGVTMFCVTCDKLGVPRPVCVQNDYSLVDRIFESDCYEACHRFGLVACHYGPLAGGVLTGKYLKDSPYAKKDPDRPLADCRMRSQPGFQPRYGMPMAMKAAEKYVALAEKYGLTPAELALAWAKQQTFSPSVIIGTTTVRQVEECVGAFKIKELPKALMDEIDIIHEEFRSPVCHYANKDACVEATWLGANAVTATNGAA